jgi:LSD1 subclass zinc finger protein
MDAPGNVARTVHCHACQQVVDLTGLEGFTNVRCPYCDAVMVVPVEFGNYLLLSVLGVGGMGTVYKAMDLALHRFVALKVLKPKLAADPEFIASFSREARAAAAVSHINVCQIYSFGQHGGHYYIAMELLEKSSLDERITQQSKLDEETVLKIGILVATGLRAAFQSGLLHRDVKPGNVLFNGDGVPKIVDFGLARGHETQVEQTTGQPIWGTPYYIAPEKLLNHGDDATPSMV